MKNMGKHSKVKVRTLDSLCSAAMPCKFDVSYEEGMDVEEVERLKLECHELDCCCLEETDPTQDVDDDTELLETGAGGDSCHDDDESDGENVQEETLNLTLFSPIPHLSRHITKTGTSKRKQNTLVGSEVLQ